MLINRPGQRPIIVIEPPHCATTAFRAWARQTWPNAEITNPHPNRHATAEEVHRHTQYRYADDAIWIGLVRHPHARALTMASLQLARNHQTPMVTARQIATTANRWTEDNRPYWPCAAYTHNAHGRPLVRWAYNAEKLEQALHHLLALAGGTYLAPDRINATSNKLQTTAFDAAQWHDINAASVTDYNAYGWRATTRNPQTDVVQPQPCYR